VTIETNTDFDAAFAEFSTPDDKKPADAAPAAEADAGAEGASKPVDEGASDGGADGKPSADGGSGGSAADSATGADDAAAGAAGAEGAAVAAEGGKDGAEPVVAPAAEVKTEAKPTADADDVLNRLAKIVSETKPQAEAPAAAAAPAGDEKPLYSTEEEEFLTGYDKDWGDVVRGEALKRRGEYKDLLQYIFTEVGKFVGPLRQTTEALAERTHLTDIKTNVPDYSDDLRDRVVTWAKTQPEYLQAAYDQVIQQGTADEVRDLVERYRKETGQVVAAAAPAVVTPGKDNELSEPAKQAAAALAPVESKRSGVQQPGDPSDFDDAWKQFSKVED
jgi:hypothetical protein